VTVFNRPPRPSPAETLHVATASRVAAGQSMTIISIVAMRWQTVRAPRPEREYLTVITHLPLRRWSVLRGFLRYTQQLRKELAVSSGLIGYRLQLRLFPLEFWTLSVWADEVSLWTFVHGAAHAKAMNALLAETGRTTVDHWTVQGSSVPEKWSQARQKMTSKRGENRSAS
jgi:hypothetical protein